MSGLWLFIRWLQRLLLLRLKNLGSSYCSSCASSLDCCLVDVDPEVSEYLCVDLRYEFHVVVGDDRLLEFLQAHHLPGLLALAHELGIGSLWDEGSLDLLLDQAVHIHAFEKWVGKHLVSSPLGAQALRLVLLKQPGD